MRTTGASSLQIGALDPFALGQLAPQRRDECLGSLLRPAQLDRRVLAHLEAHRAGARIDPLDPQRVRIGHSVAVGVEFLTVGLDETA